VRGHAELYWSSAAWKESSIGVYKGPGAHAGHMVTSLVLQLVFGFELKVKLGMQKRLQGLDKKLRKAGPAAFFRSLEVPGLRYKCSCMIRLDIQLV